MVLCMKLVDAERWFKSHTYLPDLWPEQLQETNTLSLLHDADSFLDLKVLCLHDRIVPVAFGVDSGKNAKALFPALLSSQPARRFREKNKSSKQNKSRNGLDAPSNAEGRRSSNASATVRDQEHDQDTPFDRPLLDTDDAAADPSRCQLGEVDADLGRCDTDGETADDAAGDEVADVLRTALDGGSDDPDDCGGHQGVASAPFVGDETCTQRSDE